ncbi:site-specific DNA-methyltransferase [Dysgonomonas sp. GY617]|uniref:site-specific DNA-methyltransferase n=1 Tax=Dysgonomonas sp. GY617 TaxID=2780420 RepID=UPI0018844C96|nr:site-specific DNA-methyltransferase [Dysgonomonas sp. GY617]MBF0576261.1 site-specific DNA-methyltransferase [Dysgonomonas sp. GY617]
MDNYKKLQDTLTEIFEMDKADLDFGIYRIMNQKRKQVEEFVDKILPSDIKKILIQAQGFDTATIQKELDEKTKGASSLGIDPNTVPAIIELQNKLKTTDIASLEQDIFSHLTNFFKRYYEGGDFISLRRYKKDVYAIPYEGEEVKLHWANADQYYIKTSEYLKNYSFILSDKKKVQFQLKEASTEQNNNKAQNNMERRFAIYTEKPVDVEGDILFINFTYELYPKATKQSDLMKDGLNLLVQHIPTEFISILDLVPTATNKNRTMLEKHIESFVARNTFDYFIHKDLGQFLRRELDFYIKNEVLAIDDIGTTSNIDQFTSQIAKIQALKLVADKIITFLAQIEDFQKKLWLKKKFVTSTNYCITLDRIPTSYYDEIASNKAQVDEWKKLFDVTITNKEQLEEEQYLLLDTKLFTEEFKDRLLAEFDNLDEQTDGLLINSENFQALNLMQEKYDSAIDVCYIDPPYNAKSSEIIYKNTYKHSSFLSFLYDRIEISKQILASKSLLNVAIDDYEVDSVRFSLDEIYGRENFISNVVVVHNPRGRNDDKFYGTSHEYMLVYAKNSEIAEINNFKATEEDLKQYNKTDQISNYTLTGYMRTGNNSNRHERPNLYYSIYVDPETKRLSLNKDDNYSVEILPINNEKEEKVWRWGEETFLEKKDTEILVSFTDGEWKLQKKRRFTGEGKKPKTIWHDSRYDASTNGIMLMKALFNSVSSFSYPKSIYTVYDTLVVSSNKSSLILDYFAGSGTTGHATIKLNREDGGKRKYILVEMGTYFDTVTKPRIQKVIYSDNWKNGKPQDKVGISQMFKYQILESYEDTLNNLELKLTNEQMQVLDFNNIFKEEYLLSYMLDVESKGHLFNIEMFQNPFSYKLNVTQDNEMISTTIDLVETFNYLIGLYVEQIRREGDVKLVEGKTREGIRTLVIWRNLETIDDGMTESVFRKFYPTDKSTTLSQIYINGDYNQDLYNAKSDRFKMKPIEEAFFNKMFNISEL